MEKTTILRQTIANLPARSLTAEKGKEEEEEEGKKKRRRKERKILVVSGLAYHRVIEFFAWLIFHCARHRPLANFSLCQGRRCDLVHQPHHPDCNSHGTYLSGVPYRWHFRAEELLGRA